MRKESEAIRRAEILDASKQQGTERSGGNAVTLAGISLWHGRPSVKVWGERGRG